MVRLKGVEFWLFPEEEGVRWRFSAPEMAERGGVFELQGGLSGERWVEGRLDLRLWAPGVRVEAGDLLRSEEARIEILKGCYRLYLEEGVVLGEGEGIQAGRVRIEAPTLRGEARAFRSDFGLNRLEAESPQFEFPAEGRFGPCTVEGGEG